MEFALPTTTTGAATTAAHLEKIAHHHGQRPERVFDQLSTTTVEIANPLTKIDDGHFSLIRILSYMLSAVKTKKMKSRFFAVTSAYNSFIISSLSLPSPHCLNHSKIPDGGFAFSLANRVKF